MWAELCLNDYYKINIVSSFFNKILTADKLSPRNFKCKEYIE